MSSRIDATNKKYLARYFNDGWRKSNMYTKIFTVDDKKYPCFFAKEEIGVGIELSYDYGPGDHKWRRHGNFILIKL